MTEIFKGVLPSKSLSLPHWNNKLPGWQGITLIFVSVMVIGLGLGIGGAGLSSTIPLGRTFSCVILIVSPSLGVTLFLVTIFRK